MNKASRLASLSLARLSAVLRWKGLMNTQSTCCYRSIWVAIVRVEAWVLVWIALRGSTFILSFTLLHFSWFHAHTIPWRHPLITLPLTPDKAQILHVLVHVNCLQWIFVFLGFSWKTRGLFPLCPSSPLQASTLRLAPPTLSFTTYKLCFFNKLLYVSVASSKNEVNCSMDLIGLFWELSNICNSLDT